jgi:polysaccharide chain length determinant protein (PEP-CTERM system associated)
MLAGLVIQPNMDQQVALMSRTLLSRPNVEKLIRMADLDLSVKPGAARDELIDGVMKSIQLGGSSSTNLYVISYRDPNPERARKVVQSLLAIFVESSLGDKRQDSRTAVKFVDQQIQRYEESLQASENRLKEFKLKNMGVAGREDYYGRLSQLQSAIENARLEMQAIEQSRDAYKRELAGETPTFLPEGGPEAVSEEKLPEIDGRIAALRREQDTLLRKYTDQHPDVAGIKRLIEQLEDQRNSERAARSKAVAAGTRSPSRSLERNPMFQQLRLSLAESEANVASARAKLAGYENQYRQLKAQARLVPQIEAEFSQLNRDYDIQKKTYETLLARREAGMMGADVQDAGGAQFRVIDPPRVSPQPVAPNRIGLLGVVLAAAIAAGLFASLVASQVMPIFHDARTLREISKRPLLGMVSMLPTAALMRLRRINAYLFAGGIGALVAAFAGVFAFAMLVGRVP